MTVTHLNFLNLHLANLISGNLNLPINFGTFINLISNQIKGS